MVNFALACPVLEPKIAGWGLGLRAEFVTACLDGTKSNPMLATCFVIHEPTLFGVLLSTFASFRSLPPSFVFNALAGLSIGALSQLPRTCPPCGATLATHRDFLRHLASSGHAQQTRAALDAVGEV